MRRVLFISCLWAICLNASAQKVSKKPLDHSVFDGWQSISDQRISNDGKWILYVVKPQQGDADLVITNSKNTLKVQIPRADTARFTSDSKFIIFQIRPFYKAIARSKDQKEKTIRFPKDTLGIISHWLHNL
jgi:hypothetical protein